MTFITLLSVSHEEGRAWLLDKGRQDPWWAVCKQRHTHSLTPSQGSIKQERKTKRTFVSTKSFTIEEEETVLFGLSCFSLSALLQCSTEKCCL